MIGAENRKLLVAAASLALTLALADVATAQRGRGRTLIGVSRVQLVTLAEVQAELKLTDAQKKSAAELHEKLGQDGRALFQQGRDGGFAAIREKLEKLTQEADEKVLAMLEEPQGSRLTEVFVQLNQTRALRDPQVAKALKISEEQAKQLADVRQAKFQLAVAAFGELQTASEEQRRAKLTEMAEEGDKKLLAVLTEKQREQFANMEGESLEVDLSPLFRQPRGN